MSYRKAEEVLPAQLVELIQRYIDGESIYIPRKESNKQHWGSGTKIRQEYERRNSLIFADYKCGITISVLAKRYFLSEKSIQHIIGKLKKSA